VHLLVSEQYMYLEHWKRNVHRGTALRVAQPVCRWCKQEFLLLLGLEHRHCSQLHYT